MTVLLLVSVIAFLSTAVLIMTPRRDVPRDDDATLDDFLEGTDR